MGADQRDTISFGLLFFFSSLPPPRSTLFPYTTLFRSSRSAQAPSGTAPRAYHARAVRVNGPAAGTLARSEEHTSELQSRLHLVCRLLLEKKKKNKKTNTNHLHLQSMPPQPSHLAIVHR